MKCLLLRFTDGVFAEQCVCEREREKEILLMVVSLMGGAFNSWSSTQDATTPAGRLMFGMKAPY